MTLCILCAEALTPAAEAEDRQNCDRCEPVVKMDMPALAGWLRRETNTARSERDAFDALVEIQWDLHTDGGEERYDGGRTWQEVTCAQVEDSVTGLALWLECQEDYCHGWSSYPRLHWEEESLSDIDPRPYNVAVNLLIERWEASVGNR